MRRPLIPVLLALALAAAPARADTRVASERLAPWSLSADAGTTAWIGLRGLAYFDAAGVHRAGMGLPRTAVAVDAGTDPAGRSLLTYVRCRVRGGRHACRPYSLDPRTGRRRRIRGLSPPGCQVLAVARAGAAYAFVRRPRRHRHCRGGLFSRSASGTVRRLGALATRDVETLDIEGHYVALAGSDIRTGRERDVITTELAVFTIGGRERLSLVAAQVDSEQGRDGPLLQGVALDGGRALWISIDADSLGADEVRLNRLELADPRAEPQQVAGARWAEGFAVEGPWLFYATDDGLMRTTVPDTWDDG